MSKNRRIRNARAVRPLFVSTTKITRFRQIKPGMVVRFKQFTGRPWLFWMKPDGVLTTDIGKGINHLIRSIDEDHNHWLETTTYTTKITALATGVMSEFDLMNLELKA